MAIFGSFLLVVIDFSPRLQLRSRTPSHLKDTREPVGVTWGGTKGSTAFRTFCVRTRPRFPFTFHPPERVGVSKDDEVLKYNEDSGDQVP